MTSTVVRANKLINIAADPALWRYAARGVAAATEHRSAIAPLQIGTCIDVGANLGQFSALVRSLHPRAKLIALEPLPQAYEVYQSFFSGPDVTLHKCGAGSSSGVIPFHVTNRADSSSFLHPGENQSRAFNVNPVESLELPIARLDDLIAPETLVGPVLLKIDVQGLELDVLRGAEKLLQMVDYCYVELSFVELYEGQPLSDEVLQALFASGFDLCGVFNQVSTTSFGPTQADFLLRKRA